MSCFVTTLLWFILHLLLNRMPRIIVNFPLVSNHRIIYFINTRGDDVLMAVTDRVAVESSHYCTGQLLAKCEVAQSTLVAQLIYASSSWSGFVKAEERAKLQSNESILNKASR